MLTALIITTLLSGATTSAGPSDAPDSLPRPSSVAQPPTGVAEPARSPAMPPSADQSRAEYDRKFIDISDQPTLDCRGRVCAQTVLDVPTQGKTFRRVLEPGDFYRAVGRDDLAHSYDVAASNRRLVAGIGTAVGVGMMAFAAVWVAEHQPQAVACDPTVSFQQFQNCAQTSQDQFQRQADRNVELLLGMGVAAVAILGGSWAYALSDANPVSLEERRRLARSYDEELASHLGVPVSEEERLPARPDTVQLSLRPELSRGAGGLTLAATF